MEKILKIENLNFSYEENHILNNFSAEIKRGQITGILGANGCGKSTLLKNIIGYLKKDRGEITINIDDTQNISIENLSAKERAKIFALVPQKSKINSSLKTEEFMIMGRLPHLKNSWEGYKKNDFELLDKIFSDLEIENLKGRDILTLSGGEFQKVLLGRALIQEPKILILDEATSALDLNHAVEIMKKVKKMAVEKNITVIAVLHDINLAGRFCDEIIFVKNGKNIYQDTPQKIIQAKILKEVYNNLECKIFYDEEGIPFVIPL